MASAAAACAGERIGGVRMAARNEIAQAARKLGQNINCAEASATACPATAVGDAGLRAGDDLVSPDGVLGNRARCGSCADDVSLLRRPRRPMRRGASGSRGGRVSAARIGVRGGHCAGDIGGRGNHCRGDVSAAAAAVRGVRHLGGATYGGMARRDACNLLLLMRVTAIRAKARRRRFFCLSMLKRPPFKQSRPAECAQYGEMAW